MLAQLILLLLSRLGKFQRNSMHENKIKYRNGKCIDYAHHYMRNRMLHPRTRVKLINPWNKAQPVYQHV